MKMYNQAQRIKQWGNQKDPEVTAETYLESLTPRQKEVVFQTFMKQRTPQHIAERLNTSDRNVRDVLTRAIANIKKILTNDSGESYMDTVIFTLLWMTVPTFVIGWHISSWLYPKLKKAVLGKAA